MPPLIVREYYCNRQIPGCVHPLEDHVTRADMFAMPSVADVGSPDPFGGRRLVILGGIWRGELARCRAIGCQGYVMRRTRPRA